MRFTTSRLRRPAAGLAAFACASVAFANQPPVFTSTPYPVADVGHTYVYDARATDAEGQALRYELVQGPQGMTLDGASGALRWAPASSDAGVQSVALKVSDGAGGSAQQNFALRVREDFCAIYPLALPATVMASLQPGARVAQLERGTGAGNFSWLTWSGAVDAPTLAQSLVAPGDSDTYVGPTNPDDRLLEVGDFAQGATGSMNARDVRERLDALLGQDIVLPVWDQTRAQGAKYDYRVQRFATVRLTDYRLTGQGWIGFEYRGEARCYDDPPQAHAQSLQTPEDTPLALTLRGSDPDGDTLTYQIVSAPAQGTLTGGEAAARTYRAAADWNGSDRFTFRVFDGRTWSAPAEVVVEVIPVNDAPTAQDGSVATDEDAPVDVSLSAADPELAELSWAIVQPPAHGQLAGTGVARRYVPDPEYHGQDELRFRVSDGSLTSRIATVAILVRPVNDAPVIVTTPPVHARDGEPYLYAAEATDADAGDALSWTLTGPDGMRIDAATGRVQWTPTPQQTGTHAVSVTVRDVAGATDSQTFQVVVETGNLPPEIVSAPVQTVEEGQAYRYDVDAVDPNPADVLRYSLTQSPTGMGIDAASGVIAWQADGALAGPNLRANSMCLRSGITSIERPATADVVLVVDQSGSMAGEHAWIKQIAAPLEAHLQSNDVGSGTDRNRFGLTGFSDVAQLHTVGGAQFGDYAQLESATSKLHRGGGSSEDGWMGIDFALDTYAFRAQAARNVILITDEGRSAQASLTYSGMLASLRAKNALLNAVVDARFVCGDGSAALGLAAGQVGFKADGSGNFVTCGGAKATTGTTNTLTHYVKLALESGGAAWDLEVLRQGGIAAQSFTAAFIRTKVAEIAQQSPPTPLADPYVASLVATDAGTVRVQVGNRGLVPSQGTLRLEVLAGERIVATAEVSALAVGERRTLDLAWAPAETTQLEARLTGGASEDCSAQNNTHRVAWIVASATDPASARDTQGFSLEVTDTNQPPRIETAPPTSASVAARYAYHVGAVDADRGDALEYSLLAGPFGMLLDPVSGRLTYTPNSAAAGERFEVKLRVRDLAGAEAQQEFVLAVDGNYQPPRFTGLPLRRAQPGAVYRYQPAVRLDPTASVAWDIFRGPAGMTVDATGLVSWPTPSDFQGRTTPIVLRVRDQHGNYDLQVYTLIGDIANVAPQLGAAPTDYAQVGRSWDHGFSVTDLNVREDFTWQLRQAPAGAEVHDDGRVAWEEDEIFAGDPASRLTQYHRLCRFSDPEAASLALVSSDTRLSGRGFGQTLVAPLADTNYDGRLDDRDRTAVVGISNFGSTTNAYRVHAVDLSTRVLLWSVGTREPEPRIAPAMGDLEGNGTVTVAYVDKNGRLVALSGDGRERWSSAVVVGSGSIDFNAVSMADLEGDGRGEILIGPSVFDADGTLRWAFPASANAQSPSLALDLDADGSMEVLYRNEARNATGTLRWTTPSGRNSTVTYAAFAPIVLADGTLAVVASEETSAGPRLSLIAPDGVARWTVSGGDASGPPLVADFDADGENEIFIAATGRMHEQDGTLAWTVANVAWTPQGKRGAIAADLDGDSRIEILGFAANGFSIVAGQTGSMLSHDPNHTLGQVGVVPALVKPSGAGSAQLFAGGSSGYREYRARRGTWQSDARFFTQRAWAADRLGSNLRVAGSTRQPPAALQLLARAKPGVPVSRYQSDLQLSAPSARETASGLVLKATVTSRGTAPGRPFRVEFVRGTPSAPAELLGAQDVAALPLVGSTTVSLPALPRSAIASGEVFARIVTDPAEDECETRNNRGSGQYFELRVHDLERAEDTVAWVTGVTEASKVPVFTSTPPSTGTEGVLYSHQVQAKPHTTGDAVVYAFVTAPSGALIDPDSGWITWTPRWGQSGTFTFTVSADGMDAGAANKTWSVKVAPSALPNSAPVFASQPPLDATIGEMYTYSVLATDAEGHDVSYALTQGPTGMQIDAVTGALFWIPTSAPSAPLPVTVTATDERGAVTAQSYALRVHAVPNRVPAFGSTPTTRTFATQAWSYIVVVSDPDQDPLTLRLLASPASMTLDAATRTLSWTPTIEQLGSHDIEIEVVDGRGGFARQRFTLTVQAVAANNQAPTLGGAPAPQATVDRLYAYQPTAHDPDGDPLRFSLTGAPSGAALDAATGALRWTPTNAQLGTHAVTIRVEDGRGGWAQQRFDVMVVASSGNQPPAISSTPNETVALGATYTYSAAATDADGDPLTWRLATAPVGMQVNASTGVVSWLPRPEHVGPHAVALEVTDGRSAPVRQAWTLTVGNDASGGNRTPTLLSAPVFAAKVGRGYVYAVQAFDADGDALHYSLTAAPEGMAIDATGRITWSPAAPGPVPVTLRVDDTRAYVEQHWTIDVAAATTPLTATVLIAPQPAEPGEPITLTLDIEGAGGPVVATATLDGVTVPIVAEGITTVAAPTTPGVHALDVHVSDGADTLDVEETVLVADPNDTAAPGVALSSPDFDAEITAPVAVAGEVTGSDVVRWTLSFLDQDSGALETIAQGNSAKPQGTLGTFDPTRLLNGQYQLVLQAWDSSGNRASDSRPVRVTGDLKLGHYAITFEDVSIPLAGIPVQVTRTYDSRRRKQSLDFGHGWTVDASNVRVHESRRVGFSWSLNEYSQGFFSEWCVQPNGDPIVTVTLPDGEVMSFRAKASPECQFPTPRVDVAIVFEPIDGTDGKLTSPDFGNVRLVGSNLVDLSDPQLRTVDLTNYTLTTQEGIVYEINQHTGLRKVSEPGGQHVTYSRGGVKHSSGIGVDFVRDAQGRITQIHRPDGEVLTYQYDAAGDLVGRLDAVDEPATFGYHARLPHYLETIQDARGVLVSRNEYDPVTGKLVATVDGDGRRIEFSHDVGARVSRVKDRRGHTTTYTYDARGRVLSETNALNETIRHTYDGDGNELTRTDAANRTTTWTYDTRGNALSEKNHANETTVSTYNSKNQLLTQTDPRLKKALDNRYDSNTGLDLLGTKDALGNETVFTYDRGIGSSNTGNVSSITDAEGGVTSMIYSPYTTFQGSETDALQQVTTMRHDDMGRRTYERRERTRADGSVQSLVTRWHYDAEGRLERTEHPDGSETTLQYDGLDQPRFECDALQRCTEHVYNARGEETETIHPDGSRESKTYDANGNVLTQTDRAGRTTKFVYDAANRLTFTLFPDDTPANDDDNPRSQNVYLNGELERTIDELGRVTRYQYDAAGRRTHTILAPVAGQTATVIDHYDAAGRRDWSQDAEGQRTDYVYDDAGRLKTVVHPDETPTVATDNPRTSYDYDKLGRKVAETDELGRTTRYGYDKLGRLVVVVLPNPVTGANPALVEGSSPDAGTLTTRYAYDEVGNKIRQTDAEGRVTRWEYDAMGRETARILPAGQREEKRYNAAGELVEHTDFNGRTTRYRYDDAGRLDVVDYPRDPDVDYGYNAAGERTSVVDGRGTSSMVLDARSRVRYANDADGGRLEYQYDDAGNLIARISPSQSLVYHYDDRNRLEFVVRTVDGEAPITTRYEYHPDGTRRAMVGGDGIRTEYTYDKRNRLKDLVKKTAAGAVLLSMAYTVDASGMRTSVVERDATGISRSVTWAYDKVRRLTGEVIDHRTNTQDRTQAWTYDKVGNRKTQTLTVAGVTETTTYTYDDNDRLLTETRTGGAAAGQTTYAYDDNGNTTSKAAPAGTTTYRYDDANRLVGATTPEGTVEYVYDADGLRTRQTFTPNGETATTTWYVQDTVYPYAQVVEEYTSQGSGPKQLAATFTFADELVSQTRYANGTPTTRFIQFDGFGSTRWLTDAAGAITDTIDYDGFGKEIARSGTTRVEHLYRSERFDAGLAMYDLRARLYSPSKGRFLTQDSFRGLSMDPLSLHKYGFNHGDPVNRTDPSGHVSLIEMMISTDIQSVLRTGSTAVGRRAVKRILFGHPPKDVGVVGEMVLDWMLQGFMDHLQDGGITKQEFGQRVHRDLKNKCDAFKPLGNVRLVCEPFYDDAGNEFGHAKKGSLGVDIMIYEGKRRVIAIELKTGKGMNDRGFKGRRQRLGTSVIQITLKGDRD